MPQPAEDEAEPRISGLRWAFAALLAVSVCTLVARVAWVSEDSFITFRYVSNTLAGYGPVFNVGEYVQGYTHPLWYFLLVIGNLFVSDLIPLSIGLALFFTAGAQLLIAHTLLRLGGVTLHGGLATALFAVICVSSGAWLSFSTGGLENPLSGFLVVALVSELVLRRLQRPFVVTLLGALLVLNRPDHAVFFLPIALLLLPQLRTPAGARAVLLGAIPLVAWVAIALWLYGDLTPNTAHAKVGILPSWRDTVAQGFVYLWDWISHEPLPALTALALLVYATLRANDGPRRALAAGIWLQLVYVIQVGGDFMRGRFLLVIFIASLAFGLTTLVADLRRRGASAGWLAAAVAIGAGALLFTLPSRPEKHPGLGLPKSGIVDERMFYPGYHWSHYRKAGRIHNPYLALSLADELREFAEACGPVTVHARNPGTLGYLAGPKVQVIDLLGLTDATIAHLPRETLIQDRPRIGHPDKYIPLSYLAERGDIAFLKGWKKAVAARDCSFLAYPAAYINSEESLEPRTLYPISPDS